MTAKNSLKLLLLAILMAASESFADAPFSHHFQKSPPEVFRSAMAAFVDMGCQIDQASLDTGLITAHTSNEGKAAKIMRFSMGVSESQSQEYTLLLTPHQEGTNAKLSILRSVERNGGYRRIKFEKVPKNPEIYTAVFNEIEKGLATVPSP